MVRHYKLLAFVRTSHYDTSQAIGESEIHARQPGIEPGSLAWEARTLPLRHSSPNICLHYTTLFSFYKENYIKDK